MKSVQFKNATRVLEAPKNWDHEDIPCEDLYIQDYQTENGNVMVSAWIPDEEELESLKNGAVLFLHVHGDLDYHPVVGLSLQGA